MFRWLRISAVAVGALTVGVGSTIAIGNARWAGTVAHLADRLASAREAEPDGTEPAVFRTTDLDGLPAPVVRYFRAALKDGQPLIRTARIVQKGEFRVGPAGSQWRPLSATQHVSVRPAGLVWDAQIQMAPLVSVRVRDSYVAGTGGMRARLLAVVPVMDAPEAPELNAGALQRYLAEAAWFPTALLPSQGVAWSAIDDARALATLTDSDVTVSLEFRFNDAGDIIEVYTPGRGRFVDGRYLPTPWAGRFRRYQDRSGMRIPLEGDVEWRLPTGTIEYARIRIVDVDYAF